MDTFKAEVTKIILGLTFVGIVFLLMLPVNLSAHHFRSGTMSWEPISDDGTNITIRLKMQAGWSANHQHFRSSNDYSPFVSGYIGSIKADYYETDWGDGTDNTSMDHKILSRENLTRGGTGDCASSGSNICVNSTISEMGEYASSTWTSGLTHTYPDNGTTEYVVHWSNYARANVENSSNGGTWRNETKINIGGAYGGNKSPVSAIPPVIQVQDNKTFNYQLVATDADGDSLNFRWGKLNEFFSGDGSGSTATFTMPTGMTLSDSGLIELDVRDSVLCSGCSQNDTNY